MSMPELVGVPDPATDLAAARIVSPMSLAKTALRQEHHGVEVLLARLASRGRLSAAQIAEIAAAAARGDQPDPQVLAALRQPALTALAYLRTGEAAAGGDPAAAADLFDLVRLLSSHTGDPVGHSQLDLQTHLVAGRHDGLLTRSEADDVDPWIAWSIEADLAYPQSVDDPADVARWLEVFNRPFRDHGLDPLEIGDPTRAFDTVRTTAPAASVDGPLITIVMPVFSPSASLRTAVGSLLNQTWANLQIVIVDDASPESYAPLFEEMAALDERVELLRLPTNGGAYRARNHGLEHARGEFVGIQDGDDWSHPRRLERQMALFGEQPQLAATLSKAIRCHSDMQIVRLGALPFAQNAPSLLFRREAVLGRLGQFDQTRKAADTEFIERIELAFGPGSVETMQQPLALYQLTGGSLSREDFRLGWQHEARVSYHASFRHWHAQIAAGTADPHVSTPPPRPFPAPAEITGEAPATPGPQVVLLADWRDRSVVTTGLAAEVAALADAGFSVGLARGESLRYATEKRFYTRSDVQQLIADERATMTTLGSPISCGILLVRDPDLLTSGRPADQVRLRPERVIVVADRDPVPTTSPRVSYSAPDVETAGRAMFGCEVEWLPATASIADALSAAGTTGPIHAARLLEVVHSATAAAAPTSSTAVLGWSDASPSGVERSDRAALDALVAAGIEVRVLESPKRLQQNPHEWTSVDPAVTAAADFLDGCDYFLAARPKIAGVNLLRPQLDAMSRGCIVITDASWRPLLGDAALYLSDATVEQHLAAHPVGSPAHDAQRRRGLEFCSERLSPSVYVAAVHELIERPVEPRESRTSQLADLKPEPAAHDLAPAGPRPSARLVLVVDGDVSGTASQLNLLAELEGVETVRISLVDRSGQLDPVDVEKLEHTVDQVAVPGGLPATVAEAIEAALAATTEQFISFTDETVLGHGALPSALTRAEALAEQLDLDDVPFPLLAPLPWSETHVTETYRAWIDQHHGTWLEQHRPALDAYLQMLPYRNLAGRLDGIDVLDGGAVIRLSGYCRRGRTDGAAAPDHGLQVVVRDSEGTYVAAAPARPTLRVEAGLMQWRGFVADLPMDSIPIGKATFDLTLATPDGIEPVAIPVKASSGLLASSRPVTTYGRRFQVFPVHGSSRAEIVTQKFSGTLSRLRWTLAVSRRDLGAIAHRRPYAWARTARFLTRPLMGRGDIWLVGERPATARDNGFHLFSHLRRSRPDIRAYYVLERTSESFDELSKLGRVIPHSSWRHRLLMLHAKALLNAYAMAHMLPRQWDKRTYSQQCAWRIGAYRVYLKHGVHKDPKVVQRHRSGFDLFLTSTEAETAACRLTSAYDRQVVQTGLPRYDALIPTPPSRTILFMPTWRVYLTPKLFSTETESEVPYEGSTYQQFMDGFLSSPRLREVLERHDFQLQLMPHFNMRDHVPDVEGSRISVLDGATADIQNIMRACDLFITDHSSVNFDLAYLGTPVIYAHFDDDEYYAGHSHSSWFEHERDGFGPVAYSIDETVDAVEHYLERGCEREEIFTRRAQAAFVHHDRHNCQRVVEAVETLIETQGISS